LLDHPDVRDRHVAEYVDRVSVGRRNDVDESLDRGNLNWPNRAGHEIDQVWLILLVAGSQEPSREQRLLQVYSMEKIVTGTQDNAYLPRILGGDRILLIVLGEVTAGIDLGRLDDSKINIQGRTIEMPQAKSFATRQ
jgi:hypothetical protein